MKLDFSKLRSGICIDIKDFAAVMESLGMTLKVTFTFDAIPAPFEIPAAPAPVQVKGIRKTEVKATTIPKSDCTDHTIKKKVMEKKAAFPKISNYKKNNYQGKVMKCPYCELLKDTRSIHRHASTAHKDLYDRAAVSRYVKGEDKITIQGGIDQDLLQAVPDVRPRTRGDPTPDPADGIVRNTHVKQIKEENGFLTQGIGTVLKRTGKTCEVSYGKQGYRFISVENLEAV